jgi:hypothetical protein
MDNYFTWAGLGTLAGAVAAVVVVSNTLRVLIKVDSPWIAFVVSLLMVYGFAIVNHQLGSIAGYIISFLNSCLLFCSATGANQSAVAAGTRRAGDPEAFGSRPVRWLQPWFRTEE